MDEKNMIERQREKLHTEILNAAAAALEDFASEVCDVNGEHGMTAEARHFGRTYAAIARRRAAAIRNPDTVPETSDVRE